MRTLVLLAASLIALVSPETSSEEAEPKLVGYWRFDEGEGLVVKDASGNGKDGRVANEGRGVRRVEGRTGNAPEFSGGDPKKRRVAGCVEVPNMGEQDFAKGLTIELWVKFTKIKRPQTYELVSNTFGDRGQGFRLMLSWLRLVFSSGEGGAGKTWGAASKAAKTKIEAGVWYHVAATYDGSVYRVYLDGLEVAASGRLTMTTGRPVLYIGSYNAGYAYGLNGIVDDVRIYNHARQPMEILNDAKFGP